MKTKILIFKGGGYDGCFWEWNALFFENGKLSGSLVSGRYGNEAVEAVGDLGAFKAIRELRRGGIGRYYKSDSGVYLIRNQTQWAHFCREWNSGFVRRVAELAGQQVPCDRCGGLFCVDEIVHTGYRGNGGIGIQFTDNKCRECADLEHNEHAAGHWKYLKLKARVEAIARARDDGLDVSLFAARRNSCPPIAGRHVYEPEYY
jgi:hypothetical protein